MQPTHVYEVRPRKDHRGVDLISDALPFGRLRYGEPDAINYAIGYVKFRSRSHDAVIRVYDESGNVIETHEQAGDFQRAVTVVRTRHAIKEIFGLSGETAGATKCADKQRL